jgi:hypothetical protein
MKQTNKNLSTLTWVEIGNVKMNEIIKKVKKEWIQDMKDCFKELVTSRIGEGDEELEMLFKREGHSIEFSDNVRIFKKDNIIYILTKVDDGDGYQSFIYYYNLENKELKSKYWYNEGDVPEDYQKLLNEINVDDDFKYSLDEEDESIYHKENKYFIKNDYWYCKYSFKKDLKKRNLI